jgi:hypothetical protein
LNENEVAGRIVARLDQDLVDLPASAVQKLQAARLAAVAAYRPDRPVWGHSGTGNVLTGWGLGRGLGARLVLPAAIVLASLTGLIYWQSSSPHEEELDTAGLLAGELPIHAYTDPGFETWLKHTNYEQSKQ